MKITIAVSTILSLCAISFLVYGSSTANFTHDLSPAIGNYPGSSMYGLQKTGPIEDYVLADLYSWLEAHSGFTHTHTSMHSSTYSSSSNSTK